MRLQPLAFVVFLGALAGPVRADVTLVGVGTIPGDASDLSGLKGETSDGTPRNRLGGLGSAIAYTGTGNGYLLASDRGPKDGDTDFVCRWHTMDIRVAPGARVPVALKLTATTLLKTENGNPFVGSLGAFEHKKPERNLRLDPEGVRLGRNGNVFLADEYGPVVYEFDAKGKRVASLPVPAHFQAPKPGKSPADELPPKGSAGRQPNRGMEGLA
ncbi:MAG TPA: esterase-like activity of phytase family protein, partial [Gemmata sp.]